MPDACGSGPCDIAPIARMVSGVAAVVSAMRQGEVVLVPTVGGMCRGAQLSTTMAAVSGRNGDRARGKVRTPDDTRPTGEQLRSMYFRRPFRVTCG